MIAQESINNQTQQSPALSPTAAHFGANDIGWTALSPAIAFSVLATLVVALRWFTRTRQVTFIGVDDYVILVSLLLAWTQTGLIAASVHSGIGSYTRQPDTVQIAKLIVAMNSVWTVAVNITKGSILAQYLRIFSTRKSRICCWLLLSALLPAALWGVLGGIFLCNPTDKLWNPDIQGHCRDAQTYWVSVAGVNIGLDLLTLILPIPALAGLHLPRNQKALTLAVFLLGFAVCLVSVARLATVVAVSKSGDFVRSGVWAIILSSVEANVGVICASLLSLRNVFAKMFPKAMEESASAASDRLRLRGVEDASRSDDWRHSDASTASNNVFVLEKDPAC